MKAEEFFNLAASLGAGLLYSGRPVVGTVVINERLIGRQRSMMALFGTAAAAVVLIFWEPPAGAFNGGAGPAVLARENEVRPGAGQDAAGGGQPGRSRYAVECVWKRRPRFLRFEWGAIYFGEFCAAPWFDAFLGPRPDEGSLALDNPLVDRLRRLTTMRLLRGSASFLGRLRSGVRRDDRSAAGRRPA